MAKERCQHNHSPTRECLSFEELMQKYFIGFEEKLCSAESREEAKSMLEKAYADMQQQCESDIIRLFFKRYGNEVLERCWR